MSKFLSSVRARKSAIKALSAITIFALLISGSGNSFFIQKAEAYPAPYGPSDFSGVQCNTGNEIYGADCGTSDYHASVQMATGQAALEPALIPNGVEGYWTFEEMATDPTTFVNHVPGTNVPNAVHVGAGGTPSPIAGVIGTDWALDYVVDGGSTNYYQVDQSVGAPLQPTSALTVETWFRPIGGMQGDFINGRTFDLGTSAIGGYTMTINSNNTVTFTLFDGTVSSPGTSATSSAITSAAWHHLVGTYDSATSTMRLYVDNGSPTVVTSVPALVYSTSTEPLKVGSGNAGNIDDTTIYSRAITAGEVAAHFGTPLINPMPYQTSSHLVSDIFDTTVAGVFYSDYAITGTLPGGTTTTLYFKASDSLAALDPTTYPYTGWPSFSTATGSLLTQPHGQYFRYAIAYANTSTTIPSISSIAFNSNDGFYCPGGTNIPTGTDPGIAVGISRVQLNTIDNTVTPDGTIYHDYATAPGAGQSTTLNRSSAYNLTVTHLANTPQSVSAWIDYNNDYSFDPVTELIAADPTAATTSTLANFTVPAGATLGIMRMRVAVDNQGLGWYDSCNGGGTTAYQDYKITIAAAIGGGNQCIQTVPGICDPVSSGVTVTGTVDPIISFTLTGNTCGLGSLSTSEVRTCPIEITVQTNATSGYVASIRDVNNGTLNSGVNTIASQSVTLGAGGGETHEGFGITSSAATGTVTNNATCATSANRAVTGITSSNQSVAINTAPTLSDVTTICVGAIISDVTPAGSYTDTAMITVVGNF